MALTDTTVKKAEPGPKPAKLSDGKGMYLLVNPNGSKLWRWKYRVFGKEKVMALGVYPDTCLAQSREALATARKLLAGGADPMVQRKAEKVAVLAASENSFESVALRWWEQVHLGIGSLRLTSASDTKANWLGLEVADPLQMKFPG